MDRILDATHRKLSCTNVSIIIEIRAPLRNKEELGDALFVQEKRAGSDKISIFMKPTVKFVINVISLCLMLPFAASSAFGRIGGVFSFFSQAVSLIPGLPGDYLRVAYHVMTLDECPCHCRISFGTFFAQSSVRLGRGVYIGPYCVIASCTIGQRTQIASHVQIFGGGQQHSRDERGRILGADEAGFVSLPIGEDCWIGAAAIVMAEVGPRTTIGAGAVVPRPIPAGVVAVGNPARVIGQAHP